MKVRQESFFQAQLTRALDAKKQKKLLNTEGYSPTDSLKKDESPLKLLTIGWWNESNRMSDSQGFKIKPKPIRTLHVNSPQFKNKPSQRSPRRIQPGHVKSKSVNPQVGTLDGPFESARKTEANFSYQIEMANREKELVGEFENRLKQKLTSLRGEERRLSRQILILMKKACMVLGCVSAEHFLRRDLGINMAIVFKRYDTNHEFWRSR